MNLGELVVELSADYGNLEEQLEGAKAIAENVAASIEERFTQAASLDFKVNDTQVKDLSNSLDLLVSKIDSFTQKMMGGEQKRGTNQSKQKTSEIEDFIKKTTIVEKSLDKISKALIVINVDDSALTNLNIHLKEKEDHLNKVIEQYKNNPIVVTTVESSSSAKKTNRSQSSKKETAKKNKGQAGWDDFSPELQDAPKGIGKNISDTVAKEVDRNLNAVSASGKKVGKRIRKGAEDELDIKSPSGVFRKIGQYTIQGLLSGLSSGNNVTNKGIKLAQELIASVKKELGINSDSKIFIEIGENIIGGLITGIGDTSELISAGSSLAASLVESFEIELRDFALSDFIEAGLIESQISISEVVQDISEAIEDSFVNSIQIVESEISSGLIDSLETVLDSVEILENNSNIEFNLSFDSESVETQIEVYDNFLQQVSQNPIVIQVDDTNLIDLENRLTTLSNQFNTNVRIGVGSNETQSNTSSPPQSSVSSQNTNTDKSKLANSTNSQTDKSLSQSLGHQKNIDQDTKWIKSGTNKIVKNTLDTEKAVNRLGSNSGDKSWFELIFTFLGSLFKGNSANLAQSVTVFKEETAKGIQEVNKNLVNLTATSSGTTSLSTAALETAINNNTANLITLNTSIDTLKNNVNDNTTLVTRLNSSFTRLEHSVNTLQGEIGSLKNVISQLITQLTTLSSASFNTTALESAINDLRSQMASLESSINSISPSSPAQSANVNVTVDNTDVVNELRTIQSSIASLTSVVQGLFATQTSQSQSIDTSALETSINGLQTQISGLVAALQSSGQSSTSQPGNVTVTVDNTPVLSALIDLQNGINDLARQRTDNLESAINNLEAQISGLVAALQNSGQSSTSQPGNVNVTVDNDGLLNVLTDIRSALSDLPSSIDASIISSDSRLITELGNIIRSLDSTIRSAFSGNQPSSEFDRRSLENSLPFMEPNEIADAIARSQSSNQSAQSQALDTSNLEFVINALGERINNLSQADNSQLYDVLTQLQQLLTNLPNTIERSRSSSQATQTLTLDSSSLEDGIRALTQQMTALSNSMESSNRNLDNESSPSFDSAEIENKLQTISSQIGALTNIVSEIGSQQSTQSNNQPQSEQNQQFQENLLAVVSGAFNRFSEEMSDLKSEFRTLSGAVGNIAANQSTVASDVSIQTERVNSAMNNFADNLNNLSESMQRINSSQQTVQPIASVPTLDAENISNTTNDYLSLVSDSSAALTQASDAIRGQSVDIFDSVAGSLSEVNQLINSRKELLRNRINSIYDSLEESVALASEQMRSGLSNIPRVNISQDVVDSVQSEVNSLIGSVADGFRLITESLSNLLGDDNNATDEQKQQIRQRIQSLVDKVVAYVQGAESAIPNNAQSQFQSIRQSILDKTNQIRRGISDLLDNAESSTTKKITETQQKLNRLINLLNTNLNGLGLLLDANLSNVNRLEAKLNGTAGSIEESGDRLVSAADGLNERINASSQQFDGIEIDVTPLVDGVNTFNQQLAEVSRSVSGIESFDATEINQGVNDFKVGIQTAINEALNNALTEIGNITFTGGEVDLSSLNAVFDGLTENLTVAANGLNERIDASGEQLNGIEIDVNPLIDGLNNLRSELINQTERLQSPNLIPAESGMARLTNTLVTGFNSIRLNVNQKLSEVRRSINGIESFDATEINQGISELESGIQLAINEALNNALTEIGNITFTGGEVDLSSLNAVFDGLTENLTVAANGLNERIDASGEQLNGIEIDVNPLIDGLNNLRSELINQTERLQSPNLSPAESGMARLTNTLVTGFNSIRLNVNQKLSEVRRSINGIEPFDATEINQGVNDFKVGIQSAINEALANALAEIGNITFTGGDVDITSLNTVFDGLTQNLTVAAGGLNERINASGEQLNGIEIDVTPLVDGVNTFKAELINQVRQLQTPDLRPAVNAVSDLTRKLVNGFNSIKERVNQQLAEVSRSVAEAKINVTPINEAINGLSDEISVGIEKIFNNAEECFESTDINCHEMKKSAKDVGTEAAKCADDVSATLTKGLNDLSENLRTGLESANKAAESFIQGFEILNSSAQSFLEKASSLGQELQNSIPSTRGKRKRKPNTGASQNQNESPVDKAPGVEKSSQIVDSSPIADLTSYYSQLVQSASNVLNSVNDILLRSVANVFNQDTTALDASNTVVSELVKFLDRIQLLFSGYSVDSTAVNSIQQSSQRFIDNFISIFTESEEGLGDRKEQIKTIVASFYDNVLNAIQIESSNNSKIELNWQVINKQVQQHQSSLSNSIALIYAALEESFEDIAKTQLNISLPNLSIEEYVYETFDNVAECFATTEVDCDRMKQSAKELSDETSECLNELTTELSTGITKSIERLKEVLKEIADTPIEDIASLNKKISDELNAFQSTVSENITTLTQSSLSKLKELESHLLELIDIIDAQVISTMTVAKEKSTQTKKKTTSKETEASQAKSSVDNINKSLELVNTLAADVAKNTNALVNGVNTLLSSTTTTLTEHQAEIVTQVTGFIATFGNLFTAAKTQIDNAEPDTEGTIAASLRSLMSNTSEKINQLATTILERSATVQPVDAAIATLLNKIATTISGVKIRSNTIGKNVEALISRLERLSDTESVTNQLNSAIADSTTYIDAIRTALTAFNTTEIDQLLTSLQDYLQQSSVQNYNDLQSMVDFIRQNINALSSEVNKVFSGLPSAINDDIPVVVKSAIAQFNQRLYDVISGSIDNVHGSRVRRSATSLLTQLANKISKNIIPSDNIQQSIDRLFNSIQSSINQAEAKILAKQEEANSPELQAAVQQIKESGIPSEVINELTSSLTDIVQNTALSINEVKTGLSSTMQSINTQINNLLDALSESVDNKLVSSRLRKTLLLLLKKIEKAINESLQSVSTQNIDSSVVELLQKVSTEIHAYAIPENDIQGAINQLFANIQSNISNFLIPENALNIGGLTELSNKVNQIVYEAIGVLDELSATTIAVSSPQQTTATQSTSSRPTQGSSDSLQQSSIAKNTSTITVNTNLIRHSTDQTNKSVKTASSELTKIKSSLSASSASPESPGLMEVPSTFDEMQHYIDYSTQYIQDAIGTRGGKDQPPSGFLGFMETSVTAAMESGDPSGAYEYIKELPRLIREAITTYRNLDKILKSRDKANLSPDESKLLGKKIGTGKSSITRGIGSIANVIASDPAIARILGEQSVSAIKNLLGGKEGTTGTGVPSFQQIAKFDEAQSASMGDSAIDDLVAEVMSHLSKAFDIGQNIGDSLADGIDSENAIQAATEMAEDVTQAVKDAFEIESPSKVFMAIGRAIAQGLSLGMKSGDPLKGGKEMGARLVKGLKDVLEIRSPSGIGKKIGKNLMKSTVDAANKYAALTGIDMPKIDPNNRSAKNLKKWADELYHILNTTLSQPMRNAVSELKKAEDSLGALKTQGKQNFLKQLRRNPNAIVDDDAYENEIQRREQEIANTRDRLKTKFSPKSMEVIEQAVEIMEFTRTYKRQYNAFGSLIRGWGQTRLRGSKYDELDTRDTFPNTVQDKHSLSNAAQLLATVQQSLPDPGASSDPAQQAIIQSVQTELSRILTEITDPSNSTPIDNAYLNNLVAQIQALFVQIASIDPALVDPGLRLSANEDDVLDFIDRVDQLSTERQPLGEHTDPDDTDTPSADNTKIDEFLNQLVQKVTGGFFSSIEEMVEKFNEINQLPLTISEMSSRLEEMGERLKQRAEDAGLSINDLTGNLFDISAIDFSRFLIGLGLFKALFFDFGKISLEAAKQFESLSNQIKFAAGSFQEGTKVINSITEISKNLSVDRTSVLEGSAGLIAASRFTSLEGQGSIDVIRGLTQASAVYDLDPKAVTSSFLALEQMLSKGTVQSQELKIQLGNALPGAFNTAARSVGVTTQQLGKMLEKGEILAEEFLPKFAQQLEQETTAGLATASESYIAATARLDNAINSIQIQFGTPLLWVVKQLKHMLAGLAEFVSQHFFPIFVVGLSLISGLMVKFIGLLGLAVKGLVALFAGLVPLLLNPAGLIIAAVFLVVSALTNLLGGTERLFNNDLNKKIEFNIKTLRKAREALDGSSTPSPTTDEPSGSDRFWASLFGNNVTAKTNIALENAHAHHQVAYDLVVNDLDFSKDNKFKNTIGEISSIDKSISDLMSKRRVLAASSSDNSAPIAQLDKEIAEKYKERGELVSKTTPMTNALQQTIDGNKAIIENIKKLLESPLLRNDERDALNEKLENAENILLNLEAKQREIATLNPTINAFKVMEGVIKKATAALQDFQQKITFEANQSKVAALSSAASGGTSPAQLDVTMRRIDANALSKEATNTVETIKTIINELGANPESAMFMRNQGIGFGTGLGTLTRIEESRGDTLSAQEKTTLTSLKQLQELRNTASNAATQLAQSGFDLVKTMIDLTKQISEFYRTTQRQARTQLAEIAKLNISIASDRKTNQLRQLLANGADTLVSQFIDSIIQSIETLSEIEKARIDDSEKIRGIEDQANDEIARAIELNNQIPDAKPIKVPVSIDFGELSSEENVKKIAEQLGVSLSAAKDLTEETNNSTSAAEGVANAFSGVNDNIRTANSLMEQLRALMADTAAISSSITVQMPEVTPIPNPSNIAIPKFSMGDHLNPFSWLASIFGGPANASTPANRFAQRVAKAIDYETRNPPLIPPNLSRDPELAEGEKVLNLIAKDSVQASAKKELETTLSALVGLSGRYSKDDKSFVEYMTKVDKLISGISFKAFTPEQVLEIRYAFAEELLQEKTKISKKPIPPEIISLEDFNKLPTVKEREDALQKVLQYLDDVRNNRRALIPQSENIATNPGINTQIIVASAGISDVGGMYPAFNNTSIDTANAQSAIADLSEFNGALGSAVAFVQAFGDKLGINTDAIADNTNLAKDFGELMTDFSNIQPGDIVGWDNQDGSHMGIYLGDKKVAHRSSARANRVGIYDDLDYFQRQPGAYYARPQRRVPSNKDELNYFGFGGGMSSGSPSDNRVASTAPMVMASKVGSAVATDSGVINFIKKMEGFSANPYDDLGGGRAIGYGTPALPGDTSISEQTAASRLKAKFDGIVADLRKRYPGLTSSQYYALASLEYNGGTISENNFPKLHQALLSKNIPVAGKEILDIVRSNGKAYGGLVLRRELESEILRGVLTPEQAIAQAESRRPKAIAKANELNQSGVATSQPSTVTVPQSIKRPPLKFVTDPNKIHHNNSGRYTQIGNQRYRVGDEFVGGRLLVKDYVVSDEKGNQSTPVYNTAAGIAHLKKTSESGGFGNLVEIKNAEGKIIERIAHLASFSADLKSGQFILPGTPLGIQGTTGNSTSIHVHWEGREEDWEEKVKALKSGDYTPLLSRPANQAAIAQQGNTRPNTVLSQVKAEEQRLAEQAQMIQLALSTPRNNRILRKEAELLQQLPESPIAKALTNLSLNNQAATSQGLQTTILQAMNVISNTNAQLTARTRDFNLGREQKDILNFVRQINTAAITFLKGVFEASRTEIQDSLDLVGKVAQSLGVLSYQKDMEMQKNNASFEISQMLIDRMNKLNSFNVSLSQIKAAVSLNLTADELKEVQELLKKDMESQDGLSTEENDKLATLVAKTGQTVDTYQTMIKSERDFAALIAKYTEQINQIPVLALLKDIEIEFTLELKRIKGMEQLRNTLTDVSTEGIDLAMQNMEFDANINPAGFSPDEYRKLAAEKLALEREKRRQANEAQIRGIGEEIGLIQGVNALRKLNTQIKALPPATQPTSAESTTTNPQVTQPAPTAANQTKPDTQRISELTSSGGKSTKEQTTKTPQPNKLPKREPDPNTSITDKTQEAQTNSVNQNNQKLIQFPSPQGAVIQQEAVTQAIAQVNSLAEQYPALQELLSGNSPDVLAYLENQEDGKEIIATLRQLMSGNIPLTTEARAFLLTIENLAGKGSEIQIAEKIRAKIRNTEENKQAREDQQVREQEAKIQSDNLARLFRGTDAKANNYLAQMEEEARGLSILGLESTDLEKQKQMALTLQGREFINKRTEIERQKATLSPEEIQEQIDALNRLNQTKLDNIRLEFSEFAKAVKSGNETLKASFKDFLTGAGSITDVFDKFIRGALDGWTDMIAGQLAEALGTSINKLFGMGTDQTTSEAPIIPQDLFFLQSKPALNPTTEQTGEFSLSEEATGAASAIAGLTTEAVAGEAASISQTTALANSSAMLSGLNNIIPLTVEGIMSLGFAAQSVATSLGTSQMFAFGGPIESEVIKQGVDVIDSIPTAAKGGLVGEIGQAMRYERSLTARTPHLIVASEGERILNHRETELWNRLQNSGFQNFAEGGTVGGADSIIKSSSNATTINVPVSVSVDGGGGGGNINSSRLSDAVQRTIQDTIKKEMRPGGSINRGNPYSR